MGTATFGSDLVGFELLAVLGWGWNLLLLWLRMDDLRRSRLFPPFEELTPYS
jgi:hypothetical protein